MKIVALWGMGEMGKSTALKTFLMKLLEKYGVNAVDKDEKTITSAELKDELAAENAKFLTEKAAVKNHIVTFVINGVKYGLTTRGDSESVLSEDFDCFGECDIVFCATRTKGDSVKFVKKQSNDLIWVAKTAVTGKTELFKNPLEIINYSNEKQVEILLKIFENI